MGLSSRARRSTSPSRRRSPAPTSSTWTTASATTPSPAASAPTSARRRRSTTTTATSWSTREVGAIIVAIGLDVYDPTELDEYGYTRYDNVITSMEFERLICAGGPDRRPLRPPVRPPAAEARSASSSASARATRRSAAPTARNICCMNTVKDTLLLADHYPDTENFVFYQDIRAFGKSFEDMFQRSKEAGTRYIRGLPGRHRGRPVEPQPGHHGGEHHRRPARAARARHGGAVGGGGPAQGHGQAVEPAHPVQDLGRLLHGVPPQAQTGGRPDQGACSSPASASRPRTSRTRCCQAGAAASRAGALLNAGKVKVEAITSRIDAELCSKCGLCAAVCPYGAIVWKKGEVAHGDRGGLRRLRLLRRRPAPSAPSPCATSPTTRSWPRSGRSWRTTRRTRSFGFACNWCSYAGGDMAGISPHPVPGLEPDGPHHVLGAGVGGDGARRRSAAGRRWCWCPAATTPTATTSTPTGRR